MLLLRNVDTFTPAPAGRTDILIAGGRIIRVEPGLRVPDGLLRGRRRSGLIAVPGFIDGHVHIMGGGGEGGFATRTPELLLSDAIQGGVTTVVGCLGTDGDHAQRAKGCSPRRAGWTRRASPPSSTPATTRCRCRPSRGASSAT